MLLVRHILVPFFVVVFTPFVVSAATAKRSPGTAADNSGSLKGAIVMDAATGDVLFEDRADYSGPPASMTKLMTFAVLHDKLKAGAFALNSPVRIANEDNIGGTQVFLDPRETFSVDELIYAMMIQSANDAARALARFAGGSVPAFIGEMNAKAKQLGMTHTTFRSPHGLPPTGRRLADNDLTTPRDYALLCRHLLLSTDVLKYSSVSTRDFAPERPKGAFKMENHNKLLGKVAGVDGLKTGFTDAAGYCTSITAERNGRRLIVVIFGAFGANGQHDLGRWRDLKAIELLERGFRALPPGSPTFASAKTPASAPAPSSATTDSLLTPAPIARPSAPPADELAPRIKFPLPPVKKK
ncbi:MAG: D-alanyl-D-alanine carboxypeptidase family protein [Opitutaceae bacterium]